MPNMIHRRTVLSMLAALAAGQAIGQTSVGSTRPLTLVVAYPPGGPTDQLARALAETITSGIGRTVIVDNKPGGGGQIAAAWVRQQPADSSVVLLGDVATLGSNVALYRKFAYDPLTDFQPVTQLMATANVLYVNRANPVGSLQDLVVHAKAKGLSFASQGAGSGGHLLGVLLKTQSGADLVHVPYRGSGPAMQDLLAGQVDLLFDGVGAGLPYVRDGRLKALAVAASRRAPLLPDVPTTAEAGWPALRLETWFGAVVKTGTPKESVLALNRDLVAALLGAEMQSRFASLGYELTPTTPEQLAERMREDGRRWTELIRAQGITVE